MMPSNPRQGRRRSDRCVSLGRVEPLEGRSLLSATILPSPGGSASVQVAALPPTPPPAAPLVAFAQFQPLTGRVLVQFSGDPAGFDTSVLTNPANYSFQPLASSSQSPSPNPSRPKVGITLAPTFAITGVTLATPNVTGSSPTVVVQADNSQPIRPGAFVFTIRSAGLVDRLGRPLDGEYSGTFPSGGTQGSGDFTAILAQTRNTVLPAQPTGKHVSKASTTGVAPTYVFFPSTQAVRVRYAAAKPGKFMLAGGNNITLIALPKQDFPGTYRLSKPHAPATPKPGKFR